MLVATTIIESGIDIPQANTLIVERADIFGLAQLYQIRGRVGRVRERAYAYLLYPSAAALTEEATQAPERAQRLHRARRRLQDRHARPRDPRRRQPARRRAVRPRRGARLRAVHADARRGRRGDGGRRSTTTQPEPVRLDVNVDAYVPADYIPYEQAKIDVHRRIAGAARGRRPRRCCATSSRTASARCPSRWRTSSSLQQARIKLGQAGARAVSLPRRAARRDADRSRRPSGPRRSARQIPGRAVRAGPQSQLSVRVPEDPAAALPRGRPRRRRAARGDTRGRMSRATTSRRSVPERNLCSLHDQAARRFLALGALFVLAARPVRLRRRPCPATPSRKVGDHDHPRPTTFNHWMKIAAVASAGPAEPDRHGRADGAGARRAGLHAVHRAARRRPRPSRPRASRSTTDAQLKAAVQAGVREPARPGHAVPDLARSGSSSEAAKQNVKVTDTDVQKRVRRRPRSSRSRKDGDYQKFLAKSSGMTNADVLFRSRSQLLQHEAAREGHQGQGQGHRRPDRRLLQQEQEPLRPARAPRPAHRADEDQGEGQRGQDGARGRPALEDGRQEVLDRPGLQGPGRQAARRRQGPAGEGARRRDLRAKGKKLTRPGQDPVRLLRLRGHEDHAGQAADAASSPRRRSSRSSSSRTSRRRSTQFVKDFQKRGRPRRTAARPT